MRTFPVAGSLTSEALILPIKASSFIGRLLMWAAFNLLIIDWVIFLLSLPRPHRGGIFDIKRRSITF